MVDPSGLPRHRSSAVPLALLYAALVVYASLYPFTGWHHPQGFWSFEALSLPWPRRWLAFDVAANLVGYLPLGALVFAAAVRSGYGALPAAAAGLVLPALLSLGLELLQNHLPQRVPSALDLALNAAGAVAGVLVAALAHRRGLHERWQVLRDRWFVERSAGAITLLLLWPVGLLFPTPVPLALGQVLPQLRLWLDALADAVADVPWAAGAAAALQWADVPGEPLSPPGEAALTALGLLVPCLLAFTVTRGRWRRALLVGLVTVLGVAATTLSTALNFGPAHAPAWVAPTTLPGLGAAVALAAVLAAAPRRTAGAVGLVAVTALVALVAQAPADPYFADSLQQWEQGRFIRFHGVAQWVGWLWPYAALAYLLERVAARVEGLDSADASS